MLDENNYKVCSEELKQFIKQAKNKKCENVLISSESLFHSFSKKNKLKKFEKIVNTLGFKKIEVLAFARDPIPHSISLYKHRTKNHNITKFEKWLKESYNFLDILQDIVKNKNCVNISWTFRKYFKNSEYLMRAVFLDWLKIKKPKTKNYYVNVSLTLSELELIKESRKKMPYFDKFLKEEFSLIKNEEKAKNTYLESIYEQKAFFYLSKINNSIKKINISLPLKEKLNLPKPKNLDSSSEKENFLYSKKQLQAILLALHKYYKSNTRFGIIKNKTRKKIGIILRKCRLYDTVKNTIAFFYKLGDKKW
ncbi:MAG: hypothetical protein ACOC4G_08560 [Bacillota bacterium]